MLWRRVLRAKYGAKEGDWCSNSVLGSYGVSLCLYGKLLVVVGLLFLATFSFRLEIGLE